MGKFGRKLRWFQLLLARRKVKKMPRLKQNLGIFEKWDLRKKGRRDGKEGKFEGTLIVVDGIEKTVYYSIVVMEEMTKFISIRSQIYSSCQFDHTKATLRELINDLKRRNNELEMGLGHMLDVDTKNYRTAKNELNKGQLDQDRKNLHELTINHLEAKVYNETKRHYSAMIINLEEEVRLLEAFYAVVSNHFNRYQERILYYWNHGAKQLETLPAVAPSEWELLALKRDSRFGEMEGLLKQRRSEIEWYQTKKDQLIPEGIVERFLTNEHANGSYKQRRIKDA